MSDNITHVTDSSFDSEVLSAELPVLVDFWADWCGPCKQIAPALEELSDELGSEITIAKLNIEENPTTPVQFGVRNIPAMMIFANGQVHATKVGAMPKGKIKDWIEDSLSDA